ncbi:SCO family protein [Salinadaptatus halalkaliphilus]|uniref:SCO family protein n=1 Tax=Salinadaptatus halalkaliphilus TaxID=2419781 RepID=A0A4S3TKS3_9EURY|nr:SCO family protein [Salinadaptatus halalkaliphilus]THE64711.1 SCO family protein [Salinadaptatus halalkaliphilus]
MNRRRVLGVGATAGLATVAGCLTGALEDDTAASVVLESPGDDMRGDPSYPTYGEAFPSFELEDPLAETNVDVGALDDCIVCTMFFASCPAECVPLLNAITTVQTNTLERGIDDGTRFLAITFDPERDTADSLRDHADLMGVDLEAGNWHYLRPADADEATVVVDEQLGVPFEREELGGDDYDFLHITVTFLVNPDGYVERTYRGDDPDTARITSDLETVLERWE